MRKKGRGEKKIVFKNVNGILFPSLFNGSLLIKYHVVTVAMPSGAFEPWICEESFWRLCAWAVYHNFHSSNNIGMSGQEARLSHHYIHSLTRRLPTMLTLLGSGCKWKISVYKRGKERGKLAQLSIFNFFSFHFFPLKDLPPFFSSLL